jgi:hypothetical protein
MILTALMVMFVEWWVNALAVEIRTPYCSFSGNASSTDFEARP